MIRPLVYSILHGVFLALLPSLITPAGLAGAAELRYGDRLRAEDVRAWHERLSRFDDAAPQPDLLQLDKLIAYEENPQFAYAYGEKSVAGKNASQIRFRRVLLLKPDTLIVDDLWAGSDSSGKICRVGYTAEPVAVTPAGLAPQEILDKAKWIEADDPVGDWKETPSGRADSPDTTGGAAVRALSVFQMRDSGETPSRAGFELKPDETQLRLTIPTAAAEFVVELPRRYVDPGWISTAPTGDATAVARRPLPAGILPHGEQGIRLIERWDRAYRGNGRPGWDSGLVAEDLKQAVEQGHLRPCRVVELGCGSGTNSIYLASKGFEVTAIDVAPTALSIADEKARKAGVHVRWLLADVLNLPDLGTFDLIFDRGCYHNVRYVDAAGFVEATRRLCHPGTKCLILSLNRDSAPGVREKTMRDDFSSLFDFVWLKESEIRTGVDGSNRRESWSLLLQRK